MRCGRDWSPRNSFLGAIFAREGLDLKYDVIVLENLRFARPHEYDKSPFLKISILEKTSVFSDRKRRVRVDGRLKRKKISPFSKISGYVWTGSKTEKNDFVTFHSKIIRRENYLGTSAFSIEQCHLHISPTKCMGENYFKCNTDHIFSSKVL